MSFPLIALALTGCMKNSLGAPVDAQLDLPDDITLGWSQEYNEQHDGLGVVAYADVLVWRDDGDGVMPLENVEVEALSSYAGVYIIPQEAVQLVDYPTLPDECGGDLEGCIAEYCVDPETGEYDASQYEWCAWYSDTVTGNFYEISSSYASSDGYSPNYVRTPTDGRGLVRLFVYVDALPSTEGGGSGFSSVPIYVSIQVTSDSFAVTAAE